MAITDRLLTWMVFPSFIVLEGPSGKRKKKKKPNTIPIDWAGEMEAP